MPSHSDLDCVECGNPVNMKTAWYEVSGFAQQRKAGGLHHLAFKRMTGKLMCDPCATRRKEVHVPGQLELEVPVALRSLVK